MNEQESFTNLLGGVGATNSPSPVSEDSFPEHDGQIFEENGQDVQEVSGQNKRKSRRPPSTAERRATHNAVERARRESLNGRFMELASALPNMANVKRPSKSVIVAKSLEFVQGAQSREQYLMGQNDALRQEINELRARLGMPPLSGSPVAMPGPVALPMVNRTRKASSVSSSTGNESPHMSTPSSLNSFEAPTGTYAFNAAYASAFPGPNQPTNAQNKESNTPAVSPAAAANFNRPAPLDVNYLMALSLQQQQQQQNLMNMQNIGPHANYQPIAPWMMQHHANAPVAAGGDSSWMFN